MTQTVSATSLQKKIGLWIETAIREPVSVQRHGRESVYIISALEYHRLKRLERQALSAEEVSDEAAALIEKAEYGQ